MKIHRRRCNNCRQTSGGNALSSHQTILKVFWMNGVLELPSVETAAILSIFLSVLQPERIAQWLAHPAVVIRVAGSIPIQVGENFQDEENSGGGGSYG